MHQSDMELYEERVVCAVSDFGPLSLAKLDREAISLVMVVRWEFAMLMLRLAVKLGK